MTWLPRTGLVLLATGTLVCAGCATPGPPQPPSLQLPGRVNDLTAERSGETVSLKWTMPQRDTDRVPLKHAVPVEICRAEGAGPCVHVGATEADPGSAGRFVESLPDALRRGTPRAVRYQVELRNKSGHSAGLSNAAVIVGGQAPAPIANLSAEMRKSGVALQWQEASGGTAVRFHRKLVNASEQQPAREKRDILAPAPEPPEQDLVVAADAGQALDRAVTFGHTYEYGAQRVARVEVDGKLYELAGERSATVRVQTADVFPPAVPTGLAAVAITPEAGQPGNAAIDLSWQPVTDADTAGYFVYRRQSDEAWQRVSGPQPLSGPAFHDEHVQRGQTYEYAVSAVDRGGHESARSEEAHETVPPQ